MQPWATLAAAVTLLANGAVAQNMLRFACSQLVVDRVDPLVNPGVRYTPHLHQIVGGNSFNLTMDPDSHDLAGQSTCTSCSFAQDLSNYWTAVMFFKAKNGSYHRVPQVGNGGPQGKLVNNGGLDIYYIPSGTVTAFRPVSDCPQYPHFFTIVDFPEFSTTTARASACSPATPPTPTPKKVSSGNICHRCWTSTNEGNFVGGAPCTGSDTVDIPQDTKCKMIRQTIIFPTYVFFFPSVFSPSQCSPPN